MAGAQGGCVMGAPVFVAGSALLVSAGGRFGFMPLHGAGAGISPRQARYFSLLRQRKVPKRKATLLSASLRFAPGNLRCSVTGRAAELTARCALRSNNCGKSVHKACALRRACPPRALRSSARPEGSGDDTGHRCARPGKRRAPRGAERSDGPSRAVQPPGAAPGAGRLRGGHARRSAHASSSSLPRLYERSAAGAQ